MATKYVVHNLLADVQIGPFNSLEYTNTQAISTAFAAGMSSLNVQKTVSGHYLIANESGELWFEVIEAASNPVGRPKLSNVAVQNVLPEQPSAIVFAGRVGPNGWQKAFTPEFPESLLRTLKLPSKGFYTYYLAYTDLNWHLLSPILPIDMKEAHEDWRRNGTGLLDHLVLAGLLANSLLDEAPGEAAAAFLVSASKAGVSLVGRKALPDPLPGLATQPVVTLLRAAEVVTKDDYKL